MVHLFFSEIGINIPEKHVQMNQLVDIIALA